MWLHKKLPHSWCLKSVHIYYFTASIRQMCAMDQVNSLVRVSQGWDQGVSWAGTLTWRLRGRSCLQAHSGGWQNSAPVVAELTPRPCRMWVLLSHSRGCQHFSSSGSLRRQASNDASNCFVPQSLLFPLLLLARENCLLLKSFCDCIRFFWLIQDNLPI